MPVTEQTYRAVALEDLEGQWELHCGRLRQKPPMSYEHGHVGSKLFFDLQRQLSWDTFEVRQNHARLRISAEQTYIPDIAVVPIALLAPNRGSRELEVYEAPLPLVVEVWSPSTGAFDVDVKVQEYQRRGDLEIWRVHPYDRTVIVWRRQADGSYAESLHQHERLVPVALPGVTVDLDALFA
jgi:Uma2 family endonuclease